jgi:hypothetical protein
MVPLSRQTSFVRKMDLLRNATALVGQIVKNRDLTPDDKVFGGELETIIQEINKAIAA